jgi:hypothetical protein
MSPEIFAREQNKDTHLKEVMKKSDKLSDRIVERPTVNTSGKAGAQIPHLPLGDDPSPWGR